MLHNSIIGGYQIVIKEMSDFVPDDINIKRLQYELYRYSKVVHECVATYCSIKQLNQQVGKKYVNTLNEEYKEYYNMLSMVLDKHFRGTFIQYLVGLRISIACLNVDIFQSALSILRGKSRKLARERMPDYRLNIMLQRLDNKFFEKMNKSIDELINTLKRDKSLYAQFDYQNDMHWGKLSLDEQNKLNDAITLRVWKFISSEYSGIKVLSKAEYNRQALKFSMLLLYLNIKYKVPIIKKNLLMYLKIDGLSLNTNEYFMIKYINSSTIDNDRRIKFTEKVTTDKIPVFFPQNCSVLDQSTYIHSSKMYNTSISDNWFRIKTRNEDYLIYGECINEDIMRTRQITKDELVVVGLLGQGYLRRKKKAWKSILCLDELINKFVAEDANQSNSNKRLNRIYYMHGDFSYWMNLLLNNNGLKLFTMIFNDENATQYNLLKNKRKSKKNKDIYFGMIVIHSESLPGIFIRCYNRVIYSRVFLFLIKLVEEEKISVDESEDRTIIEKKVIQAFKAIESVWDEL
ncbi:hypothetical protein [Clostridium combesii]|uniref:hypothetical protein n=1 Tax=Clostridium combesii TaxID=39481 RepID=UPI0013FE33F2|nr:hypothetical protein [Clostridium combesii]